MDLMRGWRLSVAPFLGAALVLVGVAGCESGEQVVELTVEATTVAATATTVVVIQPTATLVPTATAEVELDVDDDLASLTDRVYELTIMLAEELSPRQSATEEELKGAMFLLEEMEELGYEVEMQEFEVTEAGASGSIEVLAGSGGDDPSVRFSRCSDNPARIFFLPFEPVKTGEAEGELVYVGIGDDEDFEGVDVEGRIVLMSRGVLTFEEKETNAAERGAVGVVVFNDEPRFYFGGRLEETPDVLVGGIPMEDGEKLRDALEDGEVVDVELLVYPDGNGPSRNVIAELNNDIDDDQVVLIGAHYDTTPWTQGANDNGSGVAAALIVADELSDDELPFDLRFVFFGSEETGLHGSEHYAHDLSEAEIGRIDAMINLDVIATGDLHVFGHAALVGHVEKVAETIDVEIEVVQPFDWGASDYAAFDERDVPFIMIHAHDLRFINHPSDTVEHIDAEPLGGTVAIVLGVIESLADSIEP